MAWLYLFFAGLFEIGWPLGLKWAQEEQTRWIGTAMAVVCMTVSGGLLWLAQRDIPIGTSYAVWTGIGAVGTALCGMWLFNEPREALRLASMGLIVAGIIGLNLGGKT